MGRNKFWRHATIRRSAIEGVKLSKKAALGTIGMNCPPISIAKFRSGVTISPKKVKSPVIHVAKLSNRQSRKLYKAEKAARKAARERYYFNASPSKVAVIEKSDVMDVRDEVLSTHQSGKSFAHDPGATVTNGTGQ